MNLETRIRQYILQNLYYAEDNALDLDASFLETGVVDSMGVMELVAFVQSEFGVGVEPDEIVVDNFDSIRKVADFVRRKCSPPPARRPGRRPAALVPGSSIPANRARGPGALVDRSSPFA
jgi:acyl carrier protein